MDYRRLPGCLTQTLPGVSFEVRKPDIDEKALGDRGREPEKLVRLLAEAKADASWLKVLGGADGLEFLHFFFGKVWRDELTGCQKHRNS